MKLFNKILLTAPLLSAVSVTIPLTSCSISPNNSVSYEGSKQIVTKSKSFELNLSLQYIMHAEQTIILKITDQLKETSVFTFKSEYTKYNLIGRRLEYTIDFEAPSYGATAFDIEVYATTQNKVVWSSTIKGFTLMYTK